VTVNYGPGPDEADVFIPEDRVAEFEEWLNDRNDPWAIGEQYDIGSVRRVPRTEVVYAKVRVLGGRVWDPLEEETP
jgi:hypothetical protein